MGSELEQIEKKIRRYTWPQVTNQVSEIIVIRVYDQIRRVVRGIVWSEVCDHVYQRVLSYKMSAFRSQVYCDISDEMYRQLRNQTGADVRVQIRNISVQVYIETCESIRNLVSDHVRDL